MWLWMVCASARECSALPRPQQLRVADSSREVSSPSAAVLGRALLAPSSSSTASDPARLRLPFLLSRMPNRDSSRASALSPTPQSRWGLLTGEGCARRLMKRSSRGNRTGGRRRSHWVCAPMDAESPPLTRRRLPLQLRVSTALLTSSSGPMLDLRVLLLSAEVRSVPSIAARQQR